MSLSRFTLVIAALAACNGKAHLDRGKVSAILKRQIACTDQPCAQKARDELGAYGNEVSRVHGLDDSDVDFLLGAERAARLNVEALERGAAPAPAPAATPPAGTAPLTRFEIFDTMWTLCRLVFGAEHPAPEAAAVEARLTAEVEARVARVGVKLSSWPHETGNADADRRSKLGYILDTASALNDAMGKYSDRDLPLLIVGANTCVLWVDYGGDQALVLNAGKGLMVGGQKANIDPDVLRPIAKAFDEHAAIEVVRKAVEDFARDLRTSLKSH